jgi:uncharacterized protein (TIGR00297 family)
MARVLTLSGAIAAALLGAVVFGVGGWEWALILISFFVSSNLLSRLAGKHKSGLNEKFSKGSRRDAWQVLANGGVSGLAVILHGFFPASPLPWLAFVGALAEANADTWATELGVLSPTAPRLITNLKLVERGTSGGVSAIGTLAAWLGAGFIAILAGFFPPAGFAGFNLTTFFWLSLAGLAGSLLDSLLGASCQAIYLCPACHKETERHPLHTCGRVTIHRRGWRLMNNDWVNGLATLASSLLACLVVL